METLDLLTTAPTRFAVIAATTGGLLLSGLLGGCAGGGANSAEVQYESKAVHGHTTSGFIGDKTNIRFYPHVTENDGETSNICAAKIPAAINFKAQKILVQNIDENSPWIGFKVTSIPELSGTDCAGDKTGYVWVADQAPHRHIFATWTIDG
jgi:hypothetical protein